MSPAPWAASKIQTVNQALVRFAEIIRDDPVAALRADVAIIAFDDVAWVVQDFTNGTDFQPPVLEVHGGHQLFPTCQHGAGPH